MEKWFDVLGLNGRYSVSTIGEIRNNKSSRKKIFYKGKRGYLVVSFRINNKTIICPVHRVIANVLIPNPKGYPCVNHIDGNKTNNSVSNLEWCTYSENNKHAYDLGLKSGYWLGKSSPMKGRLNTFEIIYNGEKIDIVSVVKEKGIENNFNRIKIRISRGWSAQKAIDTPIKFKTKLND